MVSLLVRLIALAMIWYGSYSFWAQREMLVPMIRNVLADPVLMGQRWVDENLDRRERYLLSYYLPGVFGIPYVCGETNQLFEPKPDGKSLLPGDRVSGSEKQAFYYVCGDALKVSSAFTNVTVRMDRGGASGVPAVQLDDGRVGLASERPFGFRLPGILVTMESPTVFFTRNKSEIAVTNVKPSVADVSRTNFPNGSDMVLAFQPGSDLKLRFDGGEYQLKARMQAKFTETDAFLPHQAKQ